MASIELVLAYSKLDKDYVLKMPVWDFMAYFDRAKQQAQKDKKRGQ